MNRLPLRGSHLLLCLIPLLIWTGLLQAATDTRVSRSGNKLVLEFHPAWAPAETVHTDGTTALRYQFENGSPGFAPGQPELPVRILWVAVPGPTAVAFRAQMLEPVPASGVTPAITPRIFSDPRAEIGYSQDLAMDTAHFDPRTAFPQMTVTVERPRRVMDAWLVPVRICPVEVTVDRRQATTYGLVRIEMDLPVAGGEAAAAAKPLRELVVNPGELRKLAPEPRKVRDAMDHPLHSTATWFTFQISQPGFYRLDASSFSGLDVPGGADLSRARVFCGDGFAGHCDTISTEGTFAEIPVLRQSGVAYIYAHGTDFFQPDGRAINDPYNTTLTYWLTFDSPVETSPRAPVTLDGTSLLPGVTLATTAQRRFRLHEELIYDVDSKWCWSQPVAGGFTVPVNLPHLAPAELGEHVYLQVVTQGLSLSFNGVTPAYDSVLFCNAMWKGYVVDNARSGSNNTLLLTGNGDLYLKYLDVRYTIQLNYDLGGLDWFACSNGEPFGFQVTGRSGSFLVADITHRRDWSLITPQVEGSTLRFAVGGTGDSLRHFYVTHTSDVTTLNGLTRWGGPVLRTHTGEGIDYLMVTTAEMSETVQPLLDWRQTQGLTSLKAMVPDIWAEFGYGQKGPYVMRDFIKWVWENSGHRLRYLCMGGDGHYDYREITGGLPNIVPTWDTPGIESGCDVCATNCTDDYFTAFDGTITMAVGRLPASTADQMGIIVRKILDYEQHPVPGVWRDRVLVVADDDKSAYRNNEPEHTMDSDSLARIYPDFIDVRKVYLIDYPRTSTNLKPDATLALRREWNQGATILTYMGHGNTTLWAHERVFAVAQDLPFLENAGRLPVVIAGSCDVGMFNVPTSDCLAENILRWESGGSIASIAATGKTYPSGNKALVSQLLTQMVQPSRGDSTLGISMWLAKMTTFIGDFSYYQILGDPALHVAFPRHRIHLGMQPESGLVGLALHRLNGQVTERDSSTNLAWPGTAYVSVFDSWETRVYHMWLDGSPLYYRTNPPLLYRGRVPVTSGQFGAEFLLPREVHIGSNQGKVIGFVEDNLNTAASALNNLAVSEDSTVHCDATGPEIHLDFVGRMVGPGDPLTLPAQLRVRISDAFGINLTGSSGQAIQLLIDNDPSQPLSLTEDFNYDEGSYQAGEVLHTIEGLSAGQHTFTVRAMDNCNNLGVATLTVNITDPSQLQILDARSYPSPFTDRTTIVFKLSNQANVTAKVYLVNGKMVRTLDVSNPSPGGVNLLDFDGRDADGDELPNGPYVVRLDARFAWTTSAGEQTVRKTQNLQILKVK